MVSMKASQNSSESSSEESVMKRCVQLRNHTRVMKTSFHALIDPLADSAWRVENKKETKEDEELEKELKDRLTGRK